MVFSFWGFGYSLTGCGNNSLEDKKDSKFRKFSKKKSQKM